MDTEDLDAAITAQEAKVQADRLALSKAAADLVQSISSDLPDLIDKLVRLAIQSNPTVIEKLDGEKIAEMKRAIADLKAQLPEVVAAAYPKPEAWWHHGEVPTDRHAEHHPITNPMARPLGERGIMAIKIPLQAILSPYGLYVGQYRATDSLSQNSWAFGGAYTKGFDALVESSNELRSLRTQKSQAIALQKWDSAK